MWEVVFGVFTKSPDIGPCQTLEKDAAQGVEVWLNPNVAEELRVREDNLVCLSGLGLESFIFFAHKQVLRWHEVHIAVVCVILVSGNLYEIRITVPNYFSRVPNAHFQVFQNQFLNVSILQMDRSWVEIQVKHIPLMQII